VRDPLDRNLCEQIEHRPHVDACGGENGIGEAHAVEIVLQLRRDGKITFILEDPDNMRLNFKIEYLPVAARVGPSP